MSLYHDLYPHNQRAFTSVIEHFKTSYKTCVIAAPGTGKTMVGLAVGEHFQKKTLFVTYTNDIIEQTKETMERFSLDLPIQFVTYDKLIHMSTEELDRLDPELLILDEFQHSGAPMYSKPIDYLENKNPFLYELGLSATPIRDFDFQSYTLEDGSTVKGKKDMVEERFNGDIAYTYSLAEAMADGILFPPTYVRIYQVLDTTIKEYERKFKRRYNGVIPKDIEGALKRLARLSNNMKNILKKYISNGKVLVYSSNIKELKENMEKFKSIYPNATFIEYHTGQSKSEQQQAMEDIQKNTNNLTFFFVVDKFSEGIHFPETLRFTAGIFLRPTKSYRIFIQQLGRLLGRFPVLVLDFVDRIGETGTEYLYYQFQEALKKKEDAGLNIDIHDFKMIEEALEVKELLEELDKRFYMNTIKKLEYLLNNLSVEELRGISRIKKRFPDGSLIGHWCGKKIPNLLQKAKETPWDELTIEEQDALYILAQIDEKRGYTLDLIGKLLYIKKNLSVEELRKIRNVKKKFPDGTVIEAFWTNINYTLLQKAKETPWNELTEEEQDALYIVAQIDDKRGNTLDFVGKLLYIKKNLSWEKARGVTKVKKTFPNGTVIGGWWGHYIHKFLQKAKETPWNELTLEEQDALYIVAQIDDIRGDTLDFIGRLLYIKNHLSIKELRRISNVKKTFPDGAVIGSWWTTQIPNLLQKSKETPWDELTIEEQDALYILAQIDEKRGYTLDFIGKLLYIKKNLSVEELRKISQVKKTFPDGNIIGQCGIRYIQKLLQKAKETPWNELTEEEQDTLYILAQIDDKRGDTLDFIGRLLYIKKHFSAEELRKITQVKKTFPDGIVIGNWWQKNISNLLQKSREISCNELTEEEQDALYIVAQIDEKRGDTLDLVGRLLYIKNHLSIEELRGITNVKKTFPDGTVIGSWWKKALKKRLTKFIQKDVNELTEEEHYILAITRDILMIYQDIALDDSVKLALLKRNQK